ncbi:unnamed protein product [Heterobilharzia americana]|nr:unnamed protein product [Heterobilharzia americana]
MVENERFYTEFSTQLFSLNNRMHLFNSLEGITTDHFLMTMEDNRSEITHRKSCLTHIFLIHTESYHLNYFKEILVNSNITERYYWIFDEIPDIPVSDLLHLIASSNSDKIKLGFFRQFPVLNFEDLTEHKLQKGSRLLIKSALDGLTNILPDPPFIVTGQIIEGRELINATGFVIDILNELATRFNFNYRLFLPQNGTYGALNEKGEWDGVMGELVSGKVDMIAAGLTINPRRSNYVEFIGPIVEDTLGVLVKPSRANDYFFQVFYLFKLDVWIAITCSVVVNGITVWLLNRYSPFSGWNSQHPDAYANEISSVHNLWISLRCMLLQGQEGQLFSCSSRALCLLYWFMILTVHAIWQADLTAFLTKNRLELPIKSLKDLATSDKMTILTIKGTSTYNMFQVSVNNPVYESIYKKLVANPVTVYRTADAVKLVKQYDNYVHITERLLLLGVVESQESYDLIVIEEPNVVAPLGFAAQLGKEYTQTMSSYILTLRERGVIDKFMVRWNMTNDASPMDVQYQALTLWNVAGAFIVTSIFTGTSLLFLIIERVWSKWRTIKHNNSNNI